MNRDELPVWIINDALKDGLPMGNAMLREAIKRDARYIKAKAQGNHWL